MLTLVVPGGEYARMQDASGNMVIDTETGFHYTEGGIPLWKWILSPFLVLGAEGSGTIIAVLIFLLVIGGVFNSLTACGMMNYMLGKIVDRFGSVKYRLMTVLVFFFMALGSLVGAGATASRLTSHEQATAAISRKTMMKSTALIFPEFMM